MIDNLVIRMCLWLFGGALALVGIGVALFFYVGEAGHGWVLLGLVVASVLWIVGVRHYWGPDVANRFRDNSVIIQSAISSVLVVGTGIVLLIKRLTTGSW